jgi:hypothetical protein
MAGYGQGFDMTKKKIKKTHAFIVRLSIDEGKKPSKVREALEIFIQNSFDSTAKVVHKPSPSTTSQCKAKSRLLQNRVAQRISELINLPWGKDCPIEPRQMGESGTDVRLDNLARKLFSFSTECKNTENWSIPTFIIQAKHNVYPGTDWLLILTKNNHEDIVILDMEVFFKLLEKTKEQIKKETPRLLRR